MELSAPGSVELWRRACSLKSTQRWKRLNGGRDLDRLGETPPTMRQPRQRAAASSRFPLLLWLLALLATCTPAFGEGSAPTEPRPTPNLYTGEQYDPDLGMYYLRARYHNPQTGRFWNMDSFEGNNQDPPSLHKYLYCRNDPANRIDPSGHEDMGGLLAGMSLRSFAFGAAGSYAGGKYVDLAFKLYIYQDWNMATSEVEMWNNWDFLNLIPGYCFTKAFTQASKHLHSLGVTLSQMRMMTAVRKSIPIAAETGARPCLDVSLEIAGKLEQASSSGAKAALRNALGGRHTYCLFEGVVYDLSAEQYAKYLTGEALERFAVAIGTGVFSPALHDEFLRLVAAGLKL